MIPLQDTIESKRFPLTNWILIIVNSLVFLYELTLNDTEIEYFFHQYGLVPAHVSLFTENAYPFLTNIFLHGGWFHFVGNMWMLYIFGDNVEDSMGSLRYFVFYIFMGIIASFTHYILYPHSDIPALGASGAISGVMAAYMFLFPNSYIISFVPLFFLPLFIPVPAFLYIAVWFIGQFMSGTAQLLFSREAMGIAFWAHIGGFLGGVMMYKTFLANKKIREKYSQRNWYL